MTAPMLPGGTGSPPPQQPQTAFAPRQFAGRRRMGGQQDPSLSMGQPQGGQAPQPHQWQTNRPPAPQSQGGAQAPQPQTFAQMQQNGMARPAPPPMQQQSQGPSLGGQLGQSVSHALQSPSRYDLPQVQQVRDALTTQLQQQFGGQQKQLDEEMARRGILSSSIAGGYNGDLKGQQDAAMANMNAQLMQNYAATQAQDLSASLGAGQNYQNAQQQTGLAQQGQDLARQLGLGNLGISQQQANTQQQSAQNQYQLGLGDLGVQSGQLTGNYNGQQTLGAQQLAQEGSQFSQQQQLAQMLGLGNLGVSQQQANTQQQSALGQLGLGQAQLSQQGSQFNQQMGLSQQQQDLARQLGLGNLGVSQGNLTLAQQAQQAQQNQFNAAQTQQNQQFNAQLGLSQQQQDLARQLGLGNLGVSQGQLSLADRQARDDVWLRQQGVDLQGQQLAQQGSQFNQTLAQNGAQFGQNLDFQNHQLAQQGQLGQNNLLVQLMGIIGGPTGSANPALAAQVMQALGLSGVPSAQTPPGAPSNPLVPGSTPFPTIDIPTTGYGSPYGS